MKIDAMIEAQRTLDQRINENHGLTNDALFAKTLVALQVELAEMANEARFFKYWSQDQTPRTSAPCVHCNGAGKGYFAGAEWTGVMQPCMECQGIGKHPNKNPLQEEYADALHFFLSAAIKKGWERAIVRPGAVVMPAGRSLDETFLETIYFIGACHAGKWEGRIYNNMAQDEMAFHMAWINFLHIGLHHLGFTEWEIEHAYFYKNRINHERQSNGY